MDHLGDDLLPPLKFLSYLQIKYKFNNFAIGTLKFCLLLRINYFLKILVEHFLEQPLYTALYVSSIYYFEL